MEQLPQCDVCGRLTDFKHYGASACNGCACKSVINHRRVREHLHVSSLKRSSDALFPVVFPTSVLVDCHFGVRRRAVDIVVSSDAYELEWTRQAILPQPSQASDGTLLSTVRACRSRLYNRKGQFLRELDKCSVPNSTGVVKAVGPGRSYENLVRVEVHVLNEFWKDFPQLTTWLKPGVNPDVLTAHFGVVWLNVEMLLATVNNGQLDSERCLCDYTTTFRVDHASLVEYFGSIPWIADVHGIARLAVDDLLGDLRMAKLTKKASLDETEITALLLFLIAYYEKDLFIDGHHLEAFVNKLLKELHEHYKSTYWNYAERLATLMIVVGEFHQVMLEEEQWWTTLDLYCSKGPGKFPNIYEFRRSVKF